MYIKPLIYFIFRMRFALFSQPLAGTISDGNFDFSRSKELRILKKIKWE